MTTAVATDWKCKRGIAWCGTVLTKHPVQSVVFDSICPGAIGFCSDTCWGAHARARKRGAQEKLVQAKP